MIDVSVIIPTLNPHLGRLSQTLAGLVAQTLPRDQWEVFLVDNNSTTPIELASLPKPYPPSLRILHESSPGLTAARRCGLRAAQGRFCILVDDDNVLAPNYLSDVVRRFETSPKLGAAGGPSRPDFESPPPAWLQEFQGLLALRDLGQESLIATTFCAQDPTRKSYPAAAPIGAGMALRRSAVHCWLEDMTALQLADRCGNELTSGGDNDIVLTLLSQGWHVGYFPELSLHHLIPTSRMQRGYLARLNRGIARSWVQVLSKHHICPWPPVRQWTVPLRKLKAWFTYRAWRNPAARIRWQGACGHFEGRALRAKQ